VLLRLWSHVILTVWDWDALSFILFELCPFRCSPEHIMTKMFWVLAFAVAVAVAVAVF